MIAISESFALDADADTIWKVMKDPALVAQCVPGATLTDLGEDGHHKGMIRVKFGPTLVSFRGEATVRYDDEQRICTIESRGNDQRGTSRARAEGKVTLSGSKPTQVLVEGGFQVSGALGSFARTGGVHLARELLSDFAKNLAVHLGPEEQKPAPEQLSETSSVSGGKLLMRVLVEWIRSIFGRSHKA